MSRVLTALKREPVRAYVYAVVVALLTVLVATGVIDAELKDVLATAAGTLLLVDGAEAARSQVSPV